MSLHHAVSGELIPIHPLGDKLAQTASTALLKSRQLEVMRLVLPAGKSVPVHQVPGELTMQCLEGRVELQAHGKTQQLHGGEMVFLTGNEPYALRAMENCSILMTVALMRDSNA
ncbi:hypothetical protein D3870_01670 [Noviherbaspirillum cavernae]|uniref:Cupin domain-containing protein n=1 Tax=Noviherbaspirillum cavernae TaxID=2320862 RepID=A0A418WXF2_9BURK|nr:cupin domain-containing protein [Noviherbaspirillum cavernae]RJG04904.1 hypothetical protein D3870_01670 [Noviherbaspirillum cavernae]